MSPWLAELEALARRSGAVLYLVGGAVRDLLSGRAPVDIDVAGERAVELARAFADETGGTYVPWKDAWGMARVVCPDGTQIDFADLRGPTIKQDMHARDFTINAMALPLGGDLSALCDPLRGREDWAAGLLRAVAPAALRADPIRVLRAFRFAAELNLTVEPETVELARDAAPGLASAARERVAPELQRLFAAENAGVQIRALAEVGVWAVLAPELLAMQGEDQPGYHHLDVWEHSLATVAELEALLADLPRWFEDDAAEIAEELAADVAIPLAKIGALLHDVAKPPTRTEEQEGCHFYGHERLGAKMATRIVRRWGLGGAARQAVATLVAAHMRPHHLQAHHAAGTLTLRALRRFCRGTAPHTMAVLLLAQADARAARGPKSDPDGPDRLLAFHRHLIRVRREQLQPIESAPPLLTGRDLIEELGLSPGPIFRVILESVAEARLEGEITDRDAALAYVRRRWRGKKA